MKVIIYSVDHRTGVEEFEWSGDLEEVLEADDGLSDEDIADLRNLGINESVLIGGGAASLSKIKCVALDKKDLVLRLVP